MGGDTAVSEEAEPQQLAAYHPLEFPPKSWYVGPSDSEIAATGVAYFRVGKAGVSKIIRDRSNGDVYVHRDAYPTLIHTSRGWALSGREVALLVSDGR